MTNHKQLFDSYIQNRAAVGASATALQEFFQTELTAREQALVALKLEVQERLGNGDITGAYALLYDGQGLLNMGNLVEHNGLLWEIKTERDTSGNKVWKRYDVVVEELAAKGLRLPSLQEQGKLLVAGLEGKLDGAIKDVAEDLCGEWAQGGYGYKDGKFVSCPDATFTWEGNKYVIANRGQDEFVPAKKINAGWNPITDLGDKVSEFVYQKKVDALPPKLMEDGGFYLGTEGVLWPVARGVGCGFYFVNDDVRASRGVASVKK